MIPQMIQGLTDMVRALEANTWVNDIIEASQPPLC